jgi:hypothetical protein
VHDPAEQQPVVQPVHPDAPATQPWLEHPSPVCVQSTQTRPPLPHAVLEVPPTHAPFEQHPVAQLTESHPAFPPELDPELDPEPEPDPELDAEPELDPDPELPDPDPAPELDPELDPEPELEPDSAGTRPPSPPPFGSVSPPVAQPIRATTPAAKRYGARIIYWFGWMTTELIGCTAAPAG